MAKNIQNSTQNYGRNVNSVSGDPRSNGYLKNNDLLFSIERAITTSAEHEIISDFDSHQNQSDLIFTGSVTTATSIQSIKNYTKESQKLKTFFSDEILQWSEVVLVLALILLIVITVIGNTLVILSVLTTRRLRTVTNCFVMSLAVADWLVGIFVMPPSVAYHLIGSWQLGYTLCDIWISLDVLLCTASILSLCAISIDRYLAVTQPLNYSRRRRSKRLALVMILIVWVLALAITCPPILGWYEPGRRDLKECRYNQNEGYVIFSAMGSFFIPMAVMIYVYVRISCVVASRHDNMTEIEVHKKHNKHFDIEVEVELDVEPSSEQESQSPYKKRSICQKSSTSITTSITTTTTDPMPCYKESNVHRNGHYELVDTTRPPSINRNKQKTNNNPSSNIKSCPHQFSMKQNNSSTCGEQHCPTKQIRAHHKSLSNKISSLKRENKTTQTLSIVVGGFIVCWLPFFIYYLITPFLPHEAVSADLTTCLTWLGWFNSAMNPFIYAFYSVDFRAAFWRLTFRRFFKNSLRAPYSSNAISIRR